MLAFPGDDSGATHSRPATSAAMTVSNTTSPFTLLRRVSDWPYELGEPEWRLLDHYVQRFSRTYPTFAEPDNPFLTVLLPLATRNRVVLDSLLALSGVQLWENGSFQMERPMLQLRHSAIQGSMDLLAAVAGADSSRSGPGGALMSLQAQVDACHNAPFIEGGSAAAMDNFVALLATCVLLLLYEKLSGGDQGAAIPHLQFFAALFPTRTLLSLTSLDLPGPSQPDNAGPSYAQTRPWSETLRFLSSLFLYNDLVRSTSSHTPTLSNFYYGDNAMVESLAAHFSPNRSGVTQADTLDAQPDTRRFSLPGIVARCSAGDLSVTDEDIAAWDGRFDWFPSFALVRRTKSQQNDHEPQQRLPTADPFFVLDPLRASLGSFTNPAEFGDEKIISELYRVATTIYRRQCAVHSAEAKAGWPDLNAVGHALATMGNLPTWGVELLRLLPEGSPWESCVLWPIGIVAKELVGMEERQYVLGRLMDLEKRFKIRLYSTVREQLVKVWMSRDAGGGDLDEEENVLCG